MGLYEKPLEHLSERPEECFVLSFKIRGPPVYPSPGIHLPRTLLLKVFSLSNQGGGSRMQGRRTLCGTPHHSWRPLEPLSPCETTRPWRTSTSRTSRGDPSCVMCERVWTRRVEMDPFFWWRRTTKSRFELGRRETKGLGENEKKGRRGLSHPSFPFI